MPQGNPNYPRRSTPRYGTWPAGDPRRRLLRKPYDSSAVLGLPVVVTVGVNAISATSANIIGSVNPNGSATSWWISYGTSLPLPGTATAATAIGSGTTPITVTFQLTGLVTGTTYYATVVGQSAAGTVYGQTLSFVAAGVPPTPSTPVVPFGQPSVSIPHFQMPFVLIASGLQSGVVVVEQDTTEEVVANVNTIVACQIGQCPQIPPFGRPEITFAQEPVDTDELVFSIQQWEPRASEDVASQLQTDGETWGITLTTSTTGAQTS